MTIHAVDKNFKFVEIPVQYRDRPEGSVSKLNTYADGMIVLKTIASLFKEYKPTLFFGLVAFIFFVIGLAIVIPAFDLYFKTGVVEKFPSLIVGCFSITVAILCFIAGLILEVIAKKHKQIYEMQLTQIMTEWKNRKRS